MYYYVLGFKLAAETKVWVQKLDREVLANAITGCDNFADCEKILFCDGMLHNSKIYQFNALYDS